MFKLKVTNISQHLVERLGFKFEPGSTTEIEVKTANERLALKAPITLEVEDVVDVVEVIEVVQEKPKGKKKKENTKGVE